MKFLPYEEAKAIIHKQELKSLQEWNNYCNSGKKPFNIPRNPASTYKHYWKSWGDWLGTGRIANQKRIYHPFQEARKFVQSLGLKSAKRDWTKYCKSGQKPVDIPSGPNNVYKEWKGWGGLDWYGLCFVPQADLPFLSRGPTIRAAVAVE